MKRKARVLDESVVATWLDITGDRNPLHTDAGYAAGTPFGQPIVPGHLLAALVLDEVEKTLGRERLRSAQLSIRFVGPMPVGDEFTLVWDGAAGQRHLSGMCGRGQVLTVDLARLSPGAGQ